MKSNGGSEFIVSLTGQAASTANGNESRERRPRPQGEPGGQGKQEGNAGRTQLEAAALRRRGGHRGLVHLINSRRQGNCTGVVFCQFQITWLALSHW
jgi:hypothetical protein